jgi:pimeloyl-ACP methyl ester carboxylesterase
MVGDQVRYCTAEGHRLACYRRGDGDLYLSPPIAEKLHREISESRLIRIPGAGHFIQEDEPEETAAAILDFPGGTGG